MKRSLFACISLVSLLLGCQAKQGPGTQPSASTTSPSATAPVLSTAAPSPPILDLSVGQNSGAQRVEARLLLSKVTPSDSVPIALRVTHAPGHAPKKGISIPLDWASTMESLTLSISERTSDSENKGTGGSKGSTVRLSLAGPAPALQDYLPVVHDVRVNGQGIELFKELHPWKEPNNDVLKKPGLYSLRLSGTLATSSKPSFDIGPLEVEVTAAGESFKSVVDLERLARREAAGSVTAPLSSRSPAVEDTAGNRWFRYSRMRPRDRYRSDVIEVLISPAGKVITKHEFKHFNCVAAGTLIATPGGAVLAEQLLPGDKVWGWDTTTATRVATPVRQVSRGSADTFVSLGDLLVTTEHPVFADGGWVPAGQLEPRTELLSFSGESVSVRRGLVSGTPKLVIDLSVGWPHNFFAGGFLVHNKTVHVPLGGRTAWRGLFKHGRAGAAQ